MRVFAKVVESGSFTGAAQRLGISASMLSERPVDLIAEGFDVTVRVEEMPDSSLIARQLAPCCMVVCGAPSYFERHGMPRTPSDLATHNCLTAAGNVLSYYRAWHLTAADGSALNI